jgi:hypothetical protein
VDDYAPCSILSHNLSGAGKKNERKTHYFSIDHYGFRLRLASLRPELCGGSAQVNLPLPHLISEGEAGLPAILVTASSLLARVV